MKCEGCGIHAAEWVYTLPFSAEHGWGKEVHICSECREEISEFIEKMFN